MGLNWSHGDLAQQRTKPRSFESGHPKSVVSFESIDLISQGRSSAPFKLGGGT